MLAIRIIDYNLKKKPSLTTQEGETETMYADIVYSGTITARLLIRAVAKKTGFKEGMIEGTLSELRDETLDYLGEGFRVELGEFGIFISGNMGVLQDQRTPKSQDG